ncbi:AAA domain-containing protein [candidate division KSB1 bacterium]|nr:AAA domain-containing protein [candidate division KSB1 bacterium]
MNGHSKELDLDWAEKNLKNPGDLNRTWGKNFGFDYYYPLVSRSPQIREILNLIKKVAKSNASILIQGETGTGKELIAGLIQFISLRADKPYVKVNCAALPENLLESELFGHEKGSFTGAFQTRIGKFEQAHEGTLFLDEIGDMHLSTQAKILRVLQDHEFSRVGGNRTIKVDVRIITATNKDLWDAIQDGIFRDDLFYRLNVVTINVPPLRERQEDIPLIAEFFRRKFTSELRKNTKGFTEETMRLLKNHHWPGNIRELKNLVERAVLIVEEGQMITPDDIVLTGRDYFAAGGRDRRRGEIENTGLPTLKLDKLEKEAIVKALEISKWIQKDAAKLLSISPRSLNYKIKYHNITHPGWKKNI